MGNKIESQERKVNKWCEAHNLTSRPHKKRNNHFYNKKYRKKYQKKNKR